MHTVGLKGFSNLGRINQYFKQGFFPDNFDWKITDASELKTRIDKYLSYDRSVSINEYKIRKVPVPQIYNENLERYLAEQEYILICYSDGGLPGHLLAQQDSRCAGIIAHSATFVTKAVEQAHNTKTGRRHFPVLLINNTRDLTRYMPSWYGRTQQAYDFYRDKAYPVEYHTIPRNTWHGHEFDNAFGIMTNWCQRHFSYELPVK